MIFLIKKRVCGLFSICRRLGEEWGDSRYTQGGRHTHTHTPGSSSMCPPIAAAAAAAYSSQKGRHRIVEYLITRKCDVTITNIYNQTPPLHHASQHNHVHLKFQKCYFMFNLFCISLWHLFLVTCNRDVAHTLRVVRQNEHRRHLYLVTCKYSSINCIFKF
jgi:hypothetical protein